jgi:hypothetical protein
MTRQFTGGGGRRYTMEFNGLQFPEIPSFKLSCYIIPNETDDSTRKKLTQTLHAGLLPFINQANGMAGITVTNRNEGNSANELSNETETFDPWNKWVFRLDTSIGFRGEERKSNVEYSFSGRATKVTDAWKIYSRYEYERSESRIEKDDGEKITTIRKNQDVDLHFVLSLSPHWSTGIFIEGEQTTYRNIKTAFDALPAIQYNIYDWSESDRRQFTFSYYVGPTFHKYYEITVLNKTKDWFWKQGLVINLNKIETWGEIDFSLEGGNFFPGFKTYYIETRLDVAFRVSKGVSLNFDIGAESIHNQVYLPLGELSEEDLLLNTRKLPTAYEFSGRIGLRFQFGSIFNNVVNERL